MKRRLLFMIGILLLVSGFIFLGKGLWIQAKALVAQELLTRAWQKTLATGRPVKPWPWADTKPVARLIVPEQKADCIILEGISGSTLAFGPGHFINSALPGTAGNSVIAGHRDTVFRFLKKLRIGQNLLVQKKDGRLTSYRITGVVIKPAEDIVLEQGKLPWLTLITCYPFNAVTAGGPLRFLVFARGEILSP